MREDDRPVAICLMGPTASGKTALALALAARLPLEVISVDSSQIYREMDIGTAKPSLAERQAVPHRLIDIRDPSESYSAAEFRDDALREMHAIRARGKTPLLVGGSMFYFRALEFGLSELPSADPEIRRELADAAAKQGWAALHAQLAILDPVTAARIRPTDPQRIQRALEIHRLTGLAPSRVNRAQPAAAPFRFVKIALWPSDRAALHRRIAARFEQMLERGFMNEVEALYRRGDLHLGLPSIRTVGYRQAWHYLNGRVNYNEMTAQATAATRQLAKRQLTWLRSYPGVHRVDGDEASLVDHVATLTEAAMAPTEANDRSQI